ncbi:MAG: putative amino acid-binding protein [Thermoleophilia bacterium]|jgi:glycine cleavage system transcriptional repressor|nr:putative amino acid-binding protein [Thermoleophilia bacterium]
MNQFAVAAMGTDRPGIVAAVGGAILDVGGNIDDSSMTILGGHFAMLLVVQVNESAEQLDAALRPVADHFDLLLEVRAAEPHAFSDEDRDDYVVAAYGPDKPGLVSSISNVLAAADANINDFGSRLGADHTYAMWFNVSLADSTDIPALGEELRGRGRELGLDIRLYRAEAEEL